MKRKVTLITSVILFIMIMTVSIVSANLDTTKSLISKSFDELKIKLEQINNAQSLTITPETTVAEITNSDIAINKEEFVFYKHNVDLTNTLSNNSASLSNEQLIDNLLINELTAQEALKQGVTVSEAELDEAIKYQRDAYNNFTPTNKDQEIVMELMKNRIRITGLTEEEFWNSDFVRESYRKSILGGKLMYELLSKGTLTDISDFQNYQRELLDEVREKIIYNKSNFE